MKKHILIKYVVFLGITAFLSSCFKDPGTDILLSSTSVEINEATTSAGLDISKTYLKSGPATAKDSLRVNLVGKQRSTAVSVTFAVDGTSTAVAGTHYNLVSANTISIPANSSFAYIKFNVLPLNINAGETWKLKINLTAADVPVSVNYGSFTRSIKAQ